MAEMLKREFDLLALVVRMDTRSGVAVRCSLEGHEGGEKEVVTEWSWPPEALGLPDSLSGAGRRGRGRGPRDQRFELPDELLQGLRAWMEQEDHVGRTLWLHLAPPKGYLAALPWERLLQPAIGAPVLRLPDFYQRPPRETPRTLSVALCGSAPLAKGAFGLSHHLAKLAAVYADAPRESRRIHLFTDRAHHGEVSELAGAKADELGATLVAHDPEGAARYDIPDATSRVVDPGGRLVNPWLLWMRDALRGESVDVVHLVGHGYLWGERGALAFAGSPWHEDDPRWARFVGAEELLAFSTQVGAWSIGMSSPPKNVSRVGMRLLADRLADLRPGPVLLHELRADPELSAMQAAVDFLYAPGPGRPPASDALSLWCQPYRVRTEVGASSVEGGEAWIAGGEAKEKRIFPSMSPSESGEALEDVYATSKDVPGWVAASERYVEQSVLQVAKQAEAGSLPSDFDPSALEGLIGRLKRAVADGASGSDEGGEGGSGSESRSASGSRGDADRESAGNGEGEGGGRAEGKNASDDAETSPGDREATADERPSDAADDAASPRDGRRA